ncbi:MAG: hypothetical protein ABI024_07800 [Vicinamibacterales bacterium]
MEGVAADNGGLLAAREVLLATAPVKRVGVDTRVVERLVSGATSEVRTPGNGYNKTAWQMLQ